MPIRNKTSWQIWTMLAMAVVIIVLVFFPKSCGVKDLENKIERVEDDIRQKEKQASEWQAEAIRLRKEKRVDSLKSIESEKKYIAKITILENKAAEKRRAAQPIINRNDTVKQYVDALVAVNAAQASRINELNDENRIQSLVCRDLTGAQVKELAIVKDIGLDKDIIIASQAKVIRKLKTGRVLRNVLLPAAVVGTFILGWMAGD